LNSARKIQILEAGEARIRRENLPLPPVLLSYGVSVLGTER